MNDFSLMPSATAMLEILDPEFASSTMLGFEADVLSADLPRQAFSAAPLAWVEDDDEDDDDEDFVDDDDDLDVGEEDDDDFFEDDDDEDVDEDEVAGEEE